MRGSQFETNGNCEFEDRTREPFLLSFLRFVVQVSATVCNTFVRSAVAKRCTAHVEKQQLMFCCFRNVRDVMYVFSYVDAYVSSGFCVYVYDPMLRSVCAVQSLVRGPAHARSFASAPQSWWPEAKVPMGPKDPILGTHTVQRHTIHVHDMRPTVAAIDLMPHELRPHPYIFA